MEFIISKDEYLKVKAAWAKIANRSAVDHIFYNALRGHDLKRGFSPITSLNKLQNGSTEWSTFEEAKRTAKWTIETNVHAWQAEKAKERIAALSNKFDVEFTPELCAALKELFK